MRILIVDDNFPNRYFMDKILNKYGKCDVVVNGQEAFEAFQLATNEGIPYDLICLDLNMPGMDGHEALALIRQHEKSFGIVGLDTVKVIITSALDDVANIRKAFVGQCEEYLVKPIDAQKLIETMERLLLPV